MNLHEHFRAIQKAYAAVLPEWMEDYESTGNMWHDPYVMDWKFTPIERHVWADLRDMALPFYPQIPACGYFIDFANPFLKIGIECDGKAWHDKDRDRIRDARLAASGWMIFRIEGHECFRQVNLHVECDEDLNRDDIYRHYGTTAEGVLRAIKWAYFGGRAYHDSEWLMQSTLFNHRSTPETMPVAREYRKKSGLVHIADLMPEYLALLERRMLRALA